MLNWEKGEIAVRKVSIIILFVLLMLLTVTAQADDDWICSECGRTVAGILETGDHCPYCDAHRHTWIPASCTEPARCSCGKTKGEPLGHEWEKASSTDQKACIRCGATEDLTKGHEWEEPTYDWSDDCKTITANQKSAYASQLSDTCDYVLSAGYDKNGNYYELVANQKENARGFEITVGVIKNNSWIYPLSKDFPFLGEDGLFHVEVLVSLIGDDASDGTSLLHPSRVVDKIYFVDSGAFFMECYRKSREVFGKSESYYIVFSCDTLKSTRINCNESSLIYRYCEASYESGHVKSYGQIFADNGKLIMYSETSGTTSGWLEDQVFNWSIFDTRTLNEKVIASNVKGVIPESSLSEGVFFCSDLCFYSSDGEKTIDLSEYSIDLWENGDIFFKDGLCEFIAENSLGSRFLVTIDSFGNVISEVPYETIYDHFFG